MWPLEMKRCITIPQVFQNTAQNGALLNNLRQETTIQVRFRALFSNIEGSNNVALGRDAGYSALGSSKRLYRK